MLDSLPRRSDSGLHGPHRAAASMPHPAIWIPQISRARSVRRVKRRIAAAAALVLASRPGLTPNQMKARLLGTTSPGPVGNPFADGTWRAPARS